MATFESALHGHVDAMIDACTRCGKCVDQNYLKGAAPQATLEPRESPVASMHRPLIIRRTRSHLSSAAAFALIYVDPQNSKLAEAERRQNRPRVA